MARMFQSLDMFVLSCLFLSVESNKGQILPPQNVSLRWISDFKPQLTWAPPQHSVENCTYDVTFMTKSESSREQHKNQKAPWSTYTAMEGGFLQFTVQTVCDAARSEEVVLNITNKELVSNLKCSSHSSKQSHCSWEPVSHPQTLTFFYRLQNEDQTTDADNDIVSPLKECSSYTYAGSVRTGCDLQAITSQDIHISFKGTLNNTLVWNTFVRNFLENVRPPALNWNVTKTGSKFIIHWTPPDIEDLYEWKFIIKYTECNEEKVKSVVDALSTHLDLVSHCPYRMAIKAEILEIFKETITGETPWSEEKRFDADADPNALVYAAIVIPLMFAVLAALTFVCCRKNKEKIFPKVPEPRDLLSDISDNNNKSNVRNLYIPAAEEDNCKITLVIDPHINLI